MDSETNHVGYGERIATAGPRAAGIAAEQVQIELPDMEQTIECDEIADSRNRESAASTSSCSLRAYAACYLVANKYPTIFLGSALNRQISWPVVEFQTA